MSGRGTWIALVVAAVLVAAAWIATALRRGPAEAADAREPLLPELRARLADPDDGVDRIEIERGGQRSVLVRRDGTWLAAEQADYPVQPERVDEVLRALASLQREEALSSDPARFSALGLEWQDVAGARSVGSGDATRLRVLAGGDLVADLVLGRSKFTPPGIYARRMDEGQAWRCAGTARIEADPVRYMQPVLLALPTAAASEVQWGEIVARRDDAQAWVVEGPLAEERRADAARLLPEFFTRLELDGVRELSAAPVEETIVARVGDRSVAIELLAAEDEVSGAAPSVSAARWYRVVIGDPEPGLAALAAAPETLRALEEARSRAAGREFRLPAWRANRLAGLVE